MDRLNEEASAVEKAQRLLQDIEEQIHKRQYLNAAARAADLSSELLSALSAVLKSP